MPQQPVYMRVTRHRPVSRTGARRVKEKNMSPAVAVLDAEELKRIDAYWRAANYLSVGQIYLFDNPLLKEPLQLAHIKPRLLGHWGTTPGLNFIYVHMNRVIRQQDLEHDLHRRPRPRRSGGGGEHLSRRQLQRAVFRYLAGRGGHAAAVPPVLLPGRHSQPRRARNARLDPRGRRTGLCACSTPMARCSTIRI